MRQFRLSGENVVIHSHSIFFFPHREICPKKEEQVEFHGHILLTEILGRIFKFLFFKKWRLRRRELNKMGGAGADQQTKTRGGVPLRTFTVDIAFHLVCKCRGESAALHQW